MWFLYKVWLRKNKILEGYLDSQPPTPNQPVALEGNSKFKSHLQKYLV